MKTGFLKQDRQEKMTTRKAWFTYAWRIVDEAGDDMVQPWLDTKNDAKQVAKLLDIQLLNA